LQQITSMLIHTNYNLRFHNTFGIPAVAERFATVHHPEELSVILAAAGNPQDLLLLGEGSNVLLPDLVPGLVLLNRIQGIDIVRERPREVIVAVGSGVNWHQFVLWTLRQGLGGIENLALIPGTVGASPIQNIGAYGVELKDVFEELEAIDWRTGKKQRFTAEDCQFGYRFSIFKDKELARKFYLSKIYFKLTKGHHHLNTSYGAIQELLDNWQISEPQPADVAAAVIEIRRAKLPDWRQLGNAGSFFKNPVVDRDFFNNLRTDYPQAPSYPVDEQSVKIPAGWLIDQCGWKGKRIGNVGCYSAQALVIVNYGGASGQEVLAFSEQVAASVLDRFGVVLEREVNWV